MIDGVQIPGKRTKSPMCFAPRPGPAAYSSSTTTNPTRNFVTMSLEGVGGVVDQAGDTPAAAELLQRTGYEAVVLDVNLPSHSGVTFLGEVRRLSPDTAIVMLSGCDDSAFSVVALEMGADDYCIKPITERELTLRVERAIERRELQQCAAKPASPERPGPGLHVDGPGRRAYLDGAELDLTTKEFELLQHFVGAPGQVFTRIELLQSVWDARPEWQSIDTVTEHVYRLRQKLAHHEQARDWIQTVRGAGYRFDRRAESAVIRRIS